MNERVQTYLDNGGISMCDDLAAVRWFRYDSGRKRDKAPYKTLQVQAGHRHIEVSFSPTGSTVCVYVDGLEVGRKVRRSRA